MRALPPHVLAVLLASACSDGGGTLFVDVRTDFVAGLEFSTVETVLEGRSPVSIPAFVGDDFTDSRRVAELPGLEGSVVVTVRLLSPERVAIATRRLVVDVGSNLGVTVVLTRSCVGVTCPAAGGPPTATECVGGRCVDPDCLPESPETCGAPACALDAECPTAPAACADSRCLDGICLAIGVDARCPGDELCRADIGCTPRPATTDGGVPDAGPTDAGLPPDLGPLVAAMAQALCEIIEQCTAFPADKLIGTDCIAFATSSLRDGFAAALDAYGRGTVVIDPSQFALCAEAYRALGCTAFTTRGPAECSAAIRGTIPIGAPCHYGGECVPGLHCDASAGCPGVCATREATGAACASSAECLDGLDCIDDVCARRAGVGEPCGVGGTGCVAGAVCNAPTCRAVAEIHVGDADEPCGGPTLCRLGLTCVFEAAGDVCRSFATTSGGPCRESYPDMCAPGEHCSAGPGADGICVQNPMEGEACLDRAPECAAYHLCIDGTCRARAPLGSPCLAPAECRSGACAAGTCVLAECAP